VDHPKPNLRIVEAKEMEPLADFDHTPVTSSTGDTLGSVDGFVVDIASGDPCYVVVDAGGWFKSKHFLLPMQKAHLDNTQHCVTADLSKDDVNEFPGFDKGEFRELH
jgi:hypothetical protein